MENKKMIKERTYDFAVRIVKLVQSLPRNNVCYIMGNQLLRSGTSIGANVEKATAAFSKDDFIFKMNTALKEARETN